MPSPSTWLIYSFICFSEGPLITRGPLRSCESNTAEAPDLTCSFHYTVQITSNDASGRTEKMIIKICGSQGSSFLSSTDISEISTCVFRNVRVTFL